MIEFEKIEMEELKMDNEKYDILQGKIRIIPIDEQGNADYSKAVDLTKSFVQSTSDPLDLIISLNK